MDVPLNLEVLETVDPVAFVVILVAIVVLIVYGLLAAGRRRVRTAALAERFGAEYGRTVGTTRSRRRAEHALELRTERRERYDPRPVDPEQRDAFQARWDALQAGFVDGPAFASQAALSLLLEVAVARGYPNGGIEACLDDVSVDHPGLVADLRRSRAECREWATTEHHREVFVHARALFDRVLGETDPATTVTSDDQDPTADTQRDTPQIEEQIGELQSAARS
jgi:hypothetical protein